MPKVRLHLMEGARQALLEAVQSGDLDWAFAHAVDEPDGLTAVPVLRQQLALITRPGDGPKDGQIELRDVLSRDLVLDSGRWVESRVLFAAAQSLGIVPNTRFQVDSARSILDIIRSEGLAALFTRARVRNSLERGELEAHKIVNPPLELTAYFVYDTHKPPSERDRPALEFIDALIDEHVAASPEDEIRLGQVASVLSNSAEVAPIRPPLQKVTNR